MIALICMLLIGAIQALECPITCMECLNINDATIQDLQQYAYVSFYTAINIYYNHIPNVCSLDELLVLDGITSERIDSWDCLYASCEEVEDPVAGVWQSGEWSACTMNCDDGETSTGKQTRDVSCVARDRSGATENVVCDASLKPAAKQICNEGCVAVDWYHGPWSTCSAVEGARGSVCQRTRTVQCMNSLGEMAEGCDVNKEPVAVESCDCDDISSDLQIDILRDYNMQNHHTDWFENVPGDVVILRRAQSMYVWVDSRFGDVSGQMNVAVDLIPDPLNPTTVGKNWDSWISYEPCKTCDRPSEQGWMLVNLPANAPIGKYKLSITIADHQFSPFYVIVLFNPYSPHTEEFMSDVAGIQEYIESTSGLIWRGSFNDYGTMTWAYEQHLYKNLEIALKGYTSASSGGTDEERGSVIWSSRMVSYFVGNKVCYGRWEEPYIEGDVSGGYNCDTTGLCREPWAWSTTTELFDIYREYNMQVQFCQCWVFGAVTNTVGRALGIPSRVLTNFQSAHDTEENRAIEKFYRCDESDNCWSDDDEPGTSTDSVWNFHVWNEFWMTRPDLSARGEADGWQAVDATPQERTPHGGDETLFCSGCYILGPASINLIKQNVHNKYDNEFVIGEVNANINYWKRPGSEEEGSGVGQWTLDSIWETHPDWDELMSGRKMSTKRVSTVIPSQCSSPWLQNCESLRNDITNNYKEGEPSGPGTPVDADKEWAIGDTWSTGGFSIGRRLKATSDEFIEVEWKTDHARILADDSAKTIEMFGDDYSSARVSYRVASFEPEAVVIGVTFESFAVPYDGKNKVKVSSITEHLTILPGAELEIPYEIALDSWREVLMDRVHDLHTIEIESTISFRMGDEKLTDFQQFHRSQHVICEPTSFLMNRAMCKRGDLWRLPIHSLDYDCAAAPDQDGLGDGICDEENNIFGCYDMGDCCSSTCGKGSIESAIETFSNCREEKTQCLDPRATDFDPQVCSFPELFASEANHAGCEEDVPSCDDRRKLTTVTECRRDRDCAPGYQCYKSHESTMSECILMTKVGATAPTKEDSAFECRSDSDCADGYQCYSTIDTSECIEEPFLGGEQVKEMGTPSCADNLSDLDGKYGLLEVCAQQSMTLLYPGVKHSIASYLQCQSPEHRPCASLSAVDIILEYRTDDSKAFLPCAHLITKDNMESVMRELADGDSNAVFGVYAHSAELSESAASTLRDMRVEVVDLGGFDDIKDCDCAARTYVTGGDSGRAHFCDFPFTHHGVSYDSCISTPDRPEGPWCATAQNTWGYCEEEEEEEPLDLSVFCSYPMWNIPGTQCTEDYSSCVMEPVTPACRGTYGVTKGTQCEIACSTDFNVKEVWECVDDEETSYGGIWTRRSAPVTCEMPEPAAPLSAEWDCDLTNNFIREVPYSQMSLTDGCSDAGCDLNPVYGAENDIDSAVAYCKEVCVAMDGCTGFFFQKHTNGHEICGFYTQDVSGAERSADGHQAGSQICLLL